MSKKMTVIERLEFELVYYNVADQCVIHYAMGTPHTQLLSFVL